MRPFLTRMPQNDRMAEEREMSRRGAILLGVVVTAVGAIIVAVSVLAPDGQFGATPRWVVACVGGAFLFFGGWTAAIYALGFDPKRPDDTLPSPGVQLAVFIPGMLLFVAPFHWVAFWPGPRVFSTSLSFSALSAHGTSGGNGWTGRVVFGAGAVLVDLFIVWIAVHLGRRVLRRPPPPG